MGRIRDKRPHRCGYKMSALFGIKSGLCSLKGQSNLQFRYVECPACDYIMLHIKLFFPRQAPRPAKPELK
jgi:hypothetical protein